MKELYNLKKLKSNQKLMKSLKVFQNQQKMIIMLIVI